MAEVRSRFGRRAYDFAREIYRRNLLESRNKLSKVAIEPPFLSVGFLLGDIQHGDLSGADSSADTVTGGVSQGIYTRTQVRIIKRNPFPRTFCTSRPAHRHSSCNVCGQFLFIRTISGNESRSEPLYKTKTDYYEILEVSTTATQAQIKTAYYKQSFIYHPDRNAGSEEATSRFSDISEAYTVLGNKALRKKYDRGLLSQSDLTAAARPSAKDAAGGTAKQQRESRRSVVGEEIRGGIFDFDKFYKSHYNEQLQRQKDIRVRKEEMLRRKQRISEKQLGRMLEIAVGVLLAMGIGIIISLKHG